ncbi:hypothetical protein PMAYCL1PPCAC_24224 [Pristionchus mayeri]|uniref:Uncharacterized protein n=1 Tax=Pristionchus mayeri TaxID=1317129 RepID=A0AAN5I763_9BILA|nr:hypothetical protein PMAYCL1PPCAC_24224 [Pristionchus mayeri]
MPPKAKKAWNEKSAPPTALPPSPSKDAPTPSIVHPKHKGRGRPLKTVAATAVPKEEEVQPEKSLPPPPTPLRPLPLPPLSSIPHSPTTLDASNDEQSDTNSPCDSSTQETEMESARCRPLVGKTPLTGRRKMSQFIPSSRTPRYFHSLARQVIAPVRAIQLFSPDLLSTTPIRLPDHLPPPSLSPPSDASPPTGKTATTAAIKEEAKTTDNKEIKLREGWGYKIGETKWRAVYDPSRKSIPKLPPTGPGDYSVSVEKTSEGEEPPVYLVVNPIEPPTTPLSKSSKRPWPRPKREIDYIREKDRLAAEAVKKCYDERMAEESSSSMSPPLPLGALIKIISEETMQMPNEHVYIHPTYTLTAEIITTFPLEQVSHYQKKKYKEDHVVISTSDLEEIYAIVHKIRRNKRRWAKVKERSAVDEEYRAKQRAKKIRAYETEKAKMAAMSEEERKQHNRRKWEYEKAKRLEKDPEQMAKQQRKEERRLANLAKYKTLLAEGIEDPEEKRRIQRRLRVAERTPEERMEWMKRDVEYARRKKERLKNMSKEELAKMEEEKRMKKEKKAALALLTPKERMRAQQKEYEARYKAKKMGKEQTEGRGQAVSPTKRSVKKRRVEKEEEVDDGDDHFPFHDYDENQMAVESISFPSPDRRSSLPAPANTHSSRHNNEDVEMAGPSRSHYEQRYGGDIEAEIIQLQKEAAWSDKAIHNSRVEVERLREEAESLESAIDEELRVQRERKRRIAHLTTIWREDHGEDSQG